MGGEVVAEGRCGVAAHSAKDEGVVVDEGMVEWRMESGIIAEAAHCFRLHFLNCLALKGRPSYETDGLGL